MSFNTLVAKAKRFIPGQLEVDITEFCANPEVGDDGEIQREVITLKEPGANELYQSLGETDQYQKHFPGMAENTALNVALLANSHLLPPVEANKTSVGALYAELALESDPRLFMHLAREFHAAFPWVGEFFANQNKKKADDATS